MRSIALLLFAFALTQVGVAEKKENGTFIATEEWQEIAEGQGIPAGLHVRINLQTGKKEAKLLDASERVAEHDVSTEEEQEEGEVRKVKTADSRSAALAAVPENASEAPPKGTAKHKVKISRTLSDALKTLPKDGLALEYSPEKLEHIKRQYKSYKEIKESYDDMRQNFKSDAEIITQLLAEYRNVTKGELEPPLTAQTKVSTQLRIIESFNYLVHQIDNALWFIDEGGLEHVLLPLVVNETHVGLRSQAMRVLGALTQNNPKTQIKVFERNFGSHLSQILISSTNMEELSTALYAFGSMLRKFPYAQQRIFSTSGIQALIAVLDKECELKIKAKALTLISDVMLEQQLALSAAAATVQPPAEENNPAAAATQYGELKYREWLQAHAYCETLDTIIGEKLYELLDQPDIAEYFVQAMQTTQNVCTTLWSQSPHMRHTLLTLKNRYVYNMDEYMLEVAQQIEKLIALLYPEPTEHDEL